MSPRKYLSRLGNELDTYDKYSGVALFSFGVKLCSASVISHECLLTTCLLLLRAEAPSLLMAWAFKRQA